jgi:hypothetical protein
LEHRNSPGIAIGAGVTFKFFHIRISSEIRYTRWANEAFVIVPPQASSSNQADILVGLTF